MSAPSRRGVLATLALSLGATAAVLAPDPVWSAAAESAAPSLEILTDPDKMAAYIRSKLPEPGTDPDAALLSLCAESIAAEAAFSTFSRDHDTGLSKSAEVRAEEDRRHARVVELEDRVADTPARTLGGLRAKVRVTRAAYPIGHCSQALAESILSDVLALTPPEGAPL